jgi:hypothetical protein
MTNNKINIPMHIEVQTFEEFENWVGLGENTENKLNVSKIVVNSIIDNLNESDIHIFEILVRDQGTIYDVSVNKDDYIFTLTKNLQILEKFEEFELCGKVQKAINKLKNGNKN